MESQTGESGKAIYLAEDVNQILYHLNTIPSMQIIAGGSQISEVKEHSLSIKNAKELLLCEKHDRYIELGAAVSLSEILSLGKGNIPEVLFDAVSSIADPAIRNMATIGGNICAKGQKHTLWAPLAALNARVEVKNKKESLTFPISKFPGIQQGSLLTKIRIPLDEWEVRIFKKTGPSNYFTKDSSSFTFLANIQNQLISNARVAFAGSILFYSSELENIITGSRLPLNEKSIGNLMDEAKKIYAKSIPKIENENFVKDQFFNLLEMSLRQLM